MGKGKKPFIDRKKSVTFHLVHRSQHDPLITDEKAPQHVLVETKKKDTDCDDQSKRYEEQRKYGINFDDDYNYLQHLKKPEQEVVWEYVENPNATRKRVEHNEITTAPKLQLPSSVFASEFEETEGMLNKAAIQKGPRPDWDPDVVAALDDDFDFENIDNQLEDDFMLQAMGGLDEDLSQEDKVEFNVDSDDLNESDNEESDNDCMDQLGPLMKRHFFPDEETKSRFTEYSMSSNVIRRNEQLSLLDDRFEHFFATYDDPEVGDLCIENIEGKWGQKHPYVIGCFKEFKKSKKLENYDKNWDCERIKKYENVVDSEEDPSDEFINQEIESSKKKWDCESILSKSSNLHNHPKLIDTPCPMSRNGDKSMVKQRDKITIDSKTGLPKNVFRGSELTAKALSKLNIGSLNDSGAKSFCGKTMASTISVLSIRPKDETPEEKRERKRVLKEYRSERRIEKKGNSEAFKYEKKRQTNVKINQRLNQQGVKIV